ncbi:doublecortin domain-containing protein 1 [Ammospiza nelsoni]|uniref:doublecortin domain-containing protein 1 n=1 Tax=Ammospiza nelsoni TaxID=2857394 RepID=UPI00286ACCB7|nr:doublecortin domain-containing protein 1 [Ammospiza nelsoni]
MNASLEDFLCWASSGITIQNKAPLLDRCLQNVIRPLCGPVWVFERKAFSLSGAEIYIQGVLLALHQQVNPAKCCKQRSAFCLAVLNMLCRHLLEFLGSSNIPGG